MTKARSPMTLLAIYGADMRRWPESRLRARLELIASPAFRAAWRKEQALDRALNTATGGLSEDGRMERRILARMGIAAEAPAAPQAFGQRAFAGFAAASLCLGLVLGGMFGDVGVNSDVYASEDAGIWESVLDDDAGSEIG